MGNCNARRTENALRVIHFSDLFVRMWIDCLDSRGHWFESQVMAVDVQQGVAVIHFKGCRNLIVDWNSKVLD